MKRCTKASVCRSMLIRMWVTMSMIQFMPCSTLESESEFEGCNQSSYTRKLFCPPSVSSQFTQWTRSIRPAGVAQSVERVALIFSDIPNLKVAGSSPAFGYSYTQRWLYLFCTMSLWWWERKVVGNAEEFFCVVKPGLGGQGWRWTCAAVASKIVCDLFLVLDHVFSHVWGEREWFLVQGTNVWR